MGSWVVAILGVVLMCVESGLWAALGVTGAAAQMPLIVVTYLGLRRDVWSSGWILMACLLPMEWVTAAPQGLFSLAAVLVFWGVRPVGLQLEARWSAGKAGVCALAVLAHHLLMCAYLLVTRPDSPMLSAIFSTSISGAIVAGVVAYPVGMLLWRAESAIAPSGDGRELRF